VFALICFEELWCKTLPAYGLMVFYDELVLGEMGCLLLVLF